MKSVLGGALLAMLVAWAWTGFAASPSGVTAVYWSSGCDAHGNCSGTFQEEGCTGGQRVVYRNGTCYSNANGFCGCYDGSWQSIAAPNGWTCTAPFPQGCQGSTCNGCSSGCTGTCWGYVMMDGTVSGAGNNCSSGCTCPSPGVSYGGFSNACGGATPNCGTGSCSWAAGIVGSKVVWQIQSSTCQGGCTCGCPGATPTDGATATTSCIANASMAICPEGTVPCSGQCNYKAISAGNDELTWVQDGNTCTEGADNCGCPSQPGGPCPTQVNQTTSIACGSSGGPCVPNCSGYCHYTSSGSDQAGWTWVSSSNNCTAGAMNCGCPSSPGGDCPTGPNQTRTISCGAEGGACNAGPCASRGGDHDHDGCCHDVDCDDEDPARCASCCLGTCTYRWDVTACQAAYMVYRWDGDVWKWESGDCGSCQFTEPAEPGTTIGQTVQVECRPLVSKGRWTKVSTDCHATDDTSDDRATCICGVYPQTPGTVDGETVTVPCDRHCKDNGGDGDSDGCCKDKDFNDAESSAQCGCDCLTDPFAIMSQLVRRFNRLPLLRLLRHIRGQTQPGETSYDGVLEIPTPFDDPVRLDFYSSSFTSLAALMRGGLLVLVIYQITTSLIQVFKT